MCKIKVTVEMNSSSFQMVLKVNNLKLIYNLWIKKLNELQVIVFETRKKGDQVSKI